jgi:hypothetical protein
MRVSWAFAPVHVKSHQSIATGVDKNTLQYAVPAEVSSIKSVLFGINQRSKK